MIVGVILGGCATRPYKINAVQAEGSTSAELPSGASFSVVATEATSVRDHIDDRTLARQQNSNIGAKLLDSMLSISGKAGSKNERDATTLRTEVEKSLSWVGFRHESGDSKRPQYQVRASAESSVQSYQAVEGIYEQRDTGQTQTICIGVDFLGVCSTNPVRESIKTGERKVTKYYRRTTLTVAWDKSGNITNSLTLWTTDESCDFERRMRILAGEGLRQSLRNPTQKELQVRIPEGYCR